MSKLAKALVALFAASTLALAPVAAQAATPGVGDKSNAVRYGANDPLGTRIASLNGLDDDSVTVPSPFNLNFFGEKYENVCISINGGVFPTNADTVDPATEVDPELTNCAAYDYDVAALAGEAEAPMVAVLALDIDLSMCDASLFTDVDPDPLDDSVSANGTLDPEESVNDDGFAKPCSVYYGTTTVDGKDAIVITWYRVPNNDGGNNPLLSNTIQLLLIKRDTGSDATGWDFDFEFNYATLTDDEDGYALEEDGTYDEGNCSAYTADEIIDDMDTPLDESDDTVTGYTYNKTDTYDLCRWGIGVGNYTVEDGGTVGYEFFEQYSIAQLIDSGDTAMIKHSLGSTVLGRYRCSMINGEARGCDFSAELADTGTEATDFGLVAAGLIAAGGIAVAVRRRKA